MPGYDPRFWELPFDPGGLDALPELLPDDEETPRAPAALRARQEALAAIADLVRTALTDRQRELVRLYFYEERSQSEISAMLGVSQQAISRQLFGVLREGRRVGGAVARLRKLAEQRGLDPDRWV